MNPRSPPAPRAFPAWAPVVLLTALALFVRLRGLPGTWGTDSLSYLESIRAGMPFEPDPRWERRPFLALVAAAMRLGGGAPAWASVPGVILSTAVVPVLWLALRRRLGDGVALLPAALWAFLGSDLEEIVEVSADATLALPAALVVWGLVEAARRDERKWVPLALAGLAAGAGAALKETMLLACVGFGVGALLTGRGRARWVGAAAFAAGAAAVFGVCLLALTPDRLSAASHNIATAGAPVRAGSTEFLRRITVSIPTLLLTASQAYGLLFVVSLPLLARLPLRALRGDALAAAALVGFLAFDLLPVSLESWSLLPATFPRYFLCLMPALLAALVCTLQERPASTVERGFSLVAAVCGLAFASTTGWALLVVVPGLALTAWPALPDGLRHLLTERTRLAASSAVLLAACIAWPHLGAQPDGADWAVAVAAAVLATTPWLVGRDRTGPAPYLAAALALALAIAVARSRFVPDPGWEAWRRLPPAGRVFAERIVARRLLVAAQGADAARVHVLDGDTPLPADLAADDCVLALATAHGTPGLRLIDRCRVATERLAEADARLGEAVLFEPLPR